MWVAVSDLPRSVSHPFYEKLNGLLAKYGVDEFVETQCRGFYAEKMGRPSLAPGQYFRLLLLGYFEGLDSERSKNRVESAFSFLKTFREEMERWHLRLHAPNPSLRHDVRQHDKGRRAIGCLRDR